MLQKIPEEKTALEQLRGGRSEYDKIANGGEVTERGKKSNTRDLTYVFDFEGVSDLLILLGPENLGNIILQVDQE